MIYLINYHIAILFDSMSDKDIFTQLVETLRAKAAEVLPEGSQMSIYGSRARGDARPDSDWDIQILVPGEGNCSSELWDKYAWPMEQVGWDFDEFVTPRLYTFSGWLQRSFLPFYRNVEKDKVIIFEN